jgi:hypothetical protein
MIIISLNILSTSPGVSEVLNVNPMLWYFKEFSDFKNFIKTDINTLRILNWGIEYGANKSKLRLALTIIRPDDVNRNFNTDYLENKFIIKIKNIKCFKPYLELEDSEIVALLKSEERNEKLGDLGIS